MQLFKASSATLLLLQQLRFSSVGGTWRRWRGAKLELSCLTRFASKKMTFFNFTTIFLFH